MIRIRYRNSNELSPGLHVTAERRGHRTTVYLLAGITSEERRSALRRLRLTARMGHCPRLPAGQLAFALFTDRIRTGVGRVGAVLRLHPAGSTVPVMVLSGGAIAFLLFSTVSIHVIPSRAANQPDAAGPAASASAISIDGGAPVTRSPGHRGRGSQGNPGDPGGPADPASVSRGPDAWQLTQLSDVPVTPPPAGDGRGGGSTGSGGAGSNSSATNSSSKSSGGGSIDVSNGDGTTLSGSGSGSGNQTPVTAEPSTFATSGAAPTPTATNPEAATTMASPGSSSGTSNGVCMNVGPLDVCLNI